MSSNIYLSILGNIFAWVCFLTNAEIQKIFVNFTNKLNTNLSDESLRHSHFQDLKAIYIKGP